MAFVTKPDGIKDFASGQTWEYGDAIGPTAVSPKLWAALVSEGVVSEEPSKPKPKPKPVPVPARGVEEIAPDWVAELAALNIFTVEDLAAASDKTLLSINGVGPATVAKWRAAI